jgi:Xaa-Pro aminopeptidase
VGAPPAAGVPGTGLDRLREALGREGVAQAVLSSSETLANLVGYELPWEDWPVADPFTAAPPLLLVQASRCVLVVPTLFAAYAEGVGCDVVETRTHRFRGTPPDPYAELAATLASLPLEPGVTGVEGRSLPARAADLLRARGCELVWADSLVTQSRLVKSPAEVEAVRSASRLADVIQAAVKEHAAPGQSEAELAGIAQAAMYRAAGRRVPAILTLNAGEATAYGSAIPQSRTLNPGDLVLTDTSPWFGGAWSDTANTIVVGKPTREHRRAFDALRRSLDLAISLCRPGAVAGDVDARVRASLEDWGPARYQHHTGHGIGASWCEPPLMVPGSADRIEEGMVLAAEPAVYRPGWGGMRLEHVFLVDSGGNELLSGFEHTL